MNIKLGHPIMACPFLAPAIISRLGYYEHQKFDSLQLMFIVSVCVCVRVGMRDFGKMEQQLGKLHVHYPEIKSSQVVLH